MGTLFYGSEIQIASEKARNITPLKGDGEQVSTITTMDDRDNGLSKPLCGQLSKYTNVVKGWQYRWFVLNPTQGTVEYYEREEYVKQKPRGAISLHYASVAPSDEDSVTFTIHAANGEVFKLRAENTKTRQLWVSRLMYVAQSSKSRRASTVSLDSRGSASVTTSTWYDAAAAAPRQTKNIKLRHRQRALSRSTSHIDDNPALVEVKEYVQEMYTLEEQLVEKIENLPMQGGHINALDQDMLLLKACSRATLSCLESCLSILERQHVAAARKSFNKTHLKSGAKVEWIINNKQRQDSGTKAAGDHRVSTALEESTRRLAAQTEIGFTLPLPVPPINHEDEVVDQNVTEEKDLGEIEQHKSIILHLLSQLKLGMDLTRVVLPTFILEKRSLLEMFADCMAHPNTFTRIADMSNPKARMTQVVEWYLASFHEGRKGSLAKKPYNPIIGETFHCSWDVPSGNGEATHRMVYTAEQVSHHPPVSAFHVTCPDKNIHMTGSLWTKSKFLGMSIGVTLIGSLRLVLPEHQEEYVMSLPSAYCRSILTYPWVELGDKCSIVCKKTGYSSSIVFHTKPFYGGKLHRVSGEIKTPDGSICTTISGTWNGVMKFSSTPSGTYVLDTHALPVHKKKVRPLPKQGDYESRNLWRHVTNALRLNDINTATEHKSLLERRQREEERHRKEQGLSFPTRYFQRAGDISNWLYKAQTN